MSASPVCSLCGTVNTPGAKFCAKCGNRLAIVAQSQATPSMFQTPPTGFQSPPYNYMAAQNRSNDIDRTKTGLLLLLIGVILTPVPLAGTVGDILILVGAILVIIGRKSFGAAHARNTIWSIILFAIGLAVVIAGGVAFGIALASAAIANSTGSVVDTAALGQSLASAFNILLIFSVAGGVIFGIAEVLFTYAIQKQTGKILLWAGYATSIAIAIVNFLIISPLISSAVSQSFSGGVYNPAAFIDLQSRLQILGLLAFIPAIIYAGAIYLAWSRVSHGEIPGPAPMPAPIASP